MVKMTSVQLVNKNGVSNVILRLEMNNKIILIKGVMKMKYSHVQNQEEKETEIGKLVQKVPNFYGHFRKRQSRENNNVGLKNLTKRKLFNQILLRDCGGEPINLFIMLKKKKIFKIA